MTTTTMTAPATTKALEPLLTAAEVCEILNVQKRKLVYWDRPGGPLRAVRLSRNTRRWRRSDVEALATRMV